MPPVYKHLVVDGDAKDAEIPSRGVEMCRIHSNSALPEELDGKLPSTSSTGGALVPCNLFLAGNAWEKH